MKRKLFLLLCALLTMIGVQQVKADQTPTPGNNIYFLYNEETGKFLSHADYNTWDGFAVVDEYGEPMQLEEVSTGTYRLKYYDHKEGNFTSGKDVYVSGNGFQGAWGQVGNETTFTIESVDGGYQFTTDNESKKLYVWNGDNNDRYRVADDGVLGTNSTAGEMTWRFLSLEERNNILVDKINAGYTSIIESAGLSDEMTYDIFVSTITGENWTSEDCTAKIKSATFTSTSISGGDWTYSQRRPEKNQPACGNGFCELYQTTGVLSQTVSGLTPGIYKVTMQGFERAGIAADCVTLGAAGLDGVSSYISANGNNVQLKSWYSDKTSDTEPNSTGNAFTSTSKYVNTVYAYVGDAGTLEIKVVSPQFVLQKWTIINNFTLTRYSNVNYENLKEEISFAEEVRDNSTCSNATARSTFETAISTAKSKTVIDATEDDVTALSSAIQAYEREAYPTGSYTFDMTWLLNNTSVLADGGNMDGWYNDITVSNFQAQWNNKATGEAGTSYFFEAYNGSNLAKGWALYQKATLPEGAYKLEAYAFQRNAKNDVVLAAGNSKGRFINSSGTDGHGGMRLFSTLFYSDGENESKMGIKILSSGVTDWCGLNKMKLYKVADSYTSALSSLIVTCESYLTHSTCEDGDKTTFQSAVNTAKEASGSASAQAKAYEALESARQAYVVAAEPDEGYPFDMTYLFTNADVTGQITWQGIYGWYSDQTDGNSQVMTNDEVKTDDGKDAFYEYWSDPAKENNEFTLYQKLTLPEATYSMSCYAFASPNGVEGADVSKVYFYANDTQGDLVSESVLTAKGISFVNREEQEVKIGLKALAGNKYRWMGIGYVELYKVHPQTYTVDEDQAWDNSQSGAGDVTLNRTIKAGVNTLVLPFSMTQTEVENKFGTGSKVYAVSSYNAETENISFVVRDGISANQPCLLKATEAGTTYELTDRTIVAGTPTSSGTNVTLTGSYAASISVPQATSNYIVSGDNLYQVNSTVTMKNTRAYITISGESGARLSLRFDDDDATIISALEAADAEAGAQKDGKYLENGKIVIVKNGVKYGANGQKLN